MDESHRVVRIISLDFRKAFDLTDHNRLLENIREIGVRPALANWLASYLSKRSHFTKFGNETSNLERVKGDVPEGSTLGPIAFVVQINKLPLAINQGIESVLQRTNKRHDINDEDTTLFVDDTTMFEVIDTHQHVTGVQIGNTQSKINRIIQFTENERMELNLKKFKEMVIDFRRNKTVIPLTEIGNHIFKIVDSYKLLCLWIDDDLKWNTNMEYIVKKAAKRLYFL